MVVVTFGYWVVSKLSKLDQSCRLNDVEHRLARLEMGQNQRASQNINNLANNTILLSTNVTGSISTEQDDELTPLQRAIKHRSYEEIQELLDSPGMADYTPIYDEQQKQTAIDAVNEKLQELENQYANRQPIHSI